MGSEFEPGFKPSTYQPVVQVRGAIQDVNPGLLLAVEEATLSIFEGADKRPSSSIQAAAPKPPLDTRMPTDKTP